MATKRIHERSGASRRSEYRIWQGMRQRCNNPKSRQFAQYGARGISVCAEWIGSYVAFLKAVGDRPSPLHSLERIDNNGNYEPGNVCWATSIVQQNNTRRNTLTEFNGQTVTIAQLSRLSGVAYGTLLARHGRDLEGDELAEPVDRRRGGRARLPIFKPEVTHA